MTAPVDTDRIRAAVSACPGVVRVHGRGPNGVAADAAGVEVHIVARYGVVLPDLGALVDRTLAPLLGGRPLTLVVDDVATDDEAVADDDLEPIEPVALPAGAAAPGDAALPAGAAALPGDAVALPAGAAAAAPALPAPVEPLALPPGPGSGADS